MFLHGVFFFGYITY